MSLGPRQGLILVRQVLGHGKDSPISLVVSELLGVNLSLDMREEGGVGAHNLLPSAVVNW